MAPGYLGRHQGVARLDAQMLLLHALEVEDAKQLADFVKSRYESLLMEIFE